MSLRYPVDNVNISQNFGDNPAYYKQYGQQGHNGIDIAVPVGTNVYAAESGTIVFEGWGQNSPLMGSVAGIAVIIDHGGYMTGYAHLSSTSINKGQTVNKGQLIGKSGATGGVTGPHVHFEVICKPTNTNNGYYGRVNPAPYLNSGGDSTVETIKSMYWRLMGREADAGGIATYQKAAQQKGWEFVYNDLKNSTEGQNDWNWRNPDRVRQLERELAAKPKEIVKEVIVDKPVEVIKEVIKEVPVEKIVEKEVIKEVVKGDEERSPGDLLSAAFKKLFKII